MTLTAIMLAACGGPTSNTRTTAPQGLPRTTATPTTGLTTSTAAPGVSGFLAQSASFVTANDGFVLGIISCQKGTCLALRHTTNRGAGWTSIPPPPTTLLAESQATGVSEVHFANAVDGWAFGSTLWATHNGGEDWHEVGLGGRVLAMASGAGVAYAAVQPCEPSPCNASTHLYRSPVGEDSWTEVAGVSVSGRFDLGFSLVAEGRQIFVLAANSSPEILGSPDGIHFSALPVPCSSEASRPPFLPASLAASDPTDFAVACLGGVGAGNQFKETYISHDGGHSYQQLPDPPTGGDGAELAMPAPSTLLLGAASGATFVYRSAPPGNSWTTSLFLSSGGIPLSDLAFVDPSNGALVYGEASASLSFLSAPNAPSGLGTLYLTDDAGASWHLVSIPR